MKRFNRNIFLLFSLLAFPVMVSAQCKGFVKKYLDKMTPFTHNGQMNVHQVTAGETTEMDVTFYSGQAYRLIFAYDQNLGPVYFNLLDAERNVVFTTKDNPKPYKDFNIANTMRLTVEIVTPDSQEKVKPTGCVSVIVGFKSVAPTRAGF